MDARHLIGLKWGHDEDNRHTRVEMFFRKGITFYLESCKSLLHRNKFFRSCCCAASSFQIAAATFRKSQIDHRPLSSHVGASPCAACRVGYFAAFLGHFLIPDRPSKTRRRPIIFFYLNRNGCQTFAEASFDFMDFVNSFELDTTLYIGGVIDYHF